MCHPELVSGSVVNLFHDEIPKQVRDDIVFVRLSWYAVIAGLTRNLLSRCVKSP